MIDWYNSNSVLLQTTLTTLLLALSIQVSMRVGVFSFAGIGAFGIGGYLAAIGMTKWQLETIPRDRDRRPCRGGGRRLPAGGAADRQTHRPLSGHGDHRLHPDRGGAGHQRRRTDRRGLRHLRCAG